MNTESMVKSTLMTTDILDKTKADFLPLIKTLREELANEINIKNPQLQDLDYVKKVENLLRSFDTVINLSLQQIQILKETLQELQREARVESSMAEPEFNKQFNPIKEHFNLRSSPGMKQPEQLYLEERDQKKLKRGRPKRMAQEEEQDTEEELEEDENLE